MDLHVREQGAPDGPPVVLLGALGSDLGLWDGVVARLPCTLRLIRLDLRGHGASPAPPGPYGMGALVRDAERTLEARGVRGAVLVGACLGGMVAQGLAIKRLDQVHALVLTGTAAKLGQAATWQARSEAIRNSGMAVFANEMLPLWMGPRAQVGHVAAIRKMLLRAAPEGIAACCAAMAGTDFYTPTSGLRLSTLGLAGFEDRFTPPDLQRETVELIPGARFHLMRRSGHLPMLDDAEGFAAQLTRFLADQGLCKPVAD